MIDEPLAYFLTWTTYGTWLPRDDRGWAKRKKGFQDPQPKLREWSDRKLEEPPCTLSLRQRALVDQTIRERCEMRGWKLWAVNVRSNHVHVVVFARDTSPAKVRNEFKARCSARLSEDRAAQGLPTRRRWWTERGSLRYLNDEGSLEAAILYVNEAQDKSRD